jgi:hypothetical protein
VNQIKWRGTSLAVIAGHRLHPSDAMELAGARRFGHPVGVLLVWLHVLMFGRELVPHQSSRERAPRDRLSRASRCARDPHIARMWS